MKASEIYNVVNKGWEKTCKVIFGEEIGELREFEGWLREYPKTVRIEKSAISGENVYLGAGEYCEKAKFIGFNEIDFGKKFSPLNINEIKDIDSIVEAIQERVHYSGNVVLGNSSDVINSSDITNSHVVLNCTDLGDCRVMAFSSRLRLCEYSFGVDWGGESRFVIRNTDVYQNVRTFEAHASYGTRDSFFTWAVRNSSNIMFSFGLLNESFAIGNLKLPKEKYLSIKDSILEQVKQELMKNKRFPSLYELLSNGKPKLPNEKVERKSLGDCKKVKKEIDVLFSTTTKIILGKELKDIDKYGKWLSRRVMEFRHTNSILSGEPLLMTTGSSYWNIPQNRIVSYDEMMYLKNILRLKEGEISSNLEDLLENVKKIFVFSEDMRIGQLVDICDTVVLSGDTYLCYKVCGTSSSKKSAYSFWPRNSECIFGSNTVFRSKQTINTYYSANLSRSFEVSNSYNSSDIYFSHNVENIREGMFNFNVKSMRYAIGNAEYNPEIYRKIKSSLLEQIVSELETKKELKWDIYNIGCARGK